jgi:endonuclease/exonuclease/phosphatase family metal-dependent hydrolase
VELTHLLQDANTHILLPGDFNCVLHPNGTTGHYHTSRDLTEIVRGMALTDAWTQIPLQPSYTHCTCNCASRLDRFYETGDLLTKKMGVETLPAAFRDHLVLVLRVSVHSVELRRVWRRWKMNPHLMDDADIKVRKRHEFGQWTKFKKYYLP